MENWKFASNPTVWFRRLGVVRADFAKAIGQTISIEGVRAREGSLYDYLQKSAQGMRTRISAASGHSQSICLLSP